MSKKAFSLIAAIVLLGFILSGCTRSASTAEVFTETPVTDFGFPVLTETPGQANPAEGATQAPGAKAPEEMTPQAGGGIIGTPAGEQTTVAEGEQSGGGVPAQPAEQPTTEQATQAPQPSTNVQLPAVTRPQSYTLLRGEWPYCIARRFNLPVGQLLSMNGLNINSQPPAGTVLQIPQSGSWDTSVAPRAWHSHPSTYTVDPGDSVNSIACYYGDVDPSQIIALNGLQAPYSLTTGQTLQIP